MKYLQKLSICLKKGLVVCMAATVLLTGASAAHADPIWDRWQAAETANRQGRPELAVPDWKFLVNHYAALGDWQAAALFCGWLNEYYDKIEDYENAIYYYELENTYWLKDGKDWGAVDLQRAEQIRTITEVYMSTSDVEILKKQGAPLNGKLAKFEPEYGVYIGMYSEQDPEMGNYFIKSQSVYGSKHAHYLAYSPYDALFPKQYAVNAKQAGAALQIAWEPSNGLDAVKDNAHLREWARAAKATGIPIFLRYASEMNGDWVVWHGDPLKYIEKFRLIHDVMAEEAPNVAMVWSPGDVPAYSMDVYYPGDDYVDWVGVNMYTEPYENGNPETANMQATSPIERLDYLYKTYSDRKPLMISETAVSHFAHIPQQSFTDYGLLNLHRLYQIMPLKYPRLKSINYFNVDLKDRESRNNYLLGDNEAMKKLYSSMISAPFYVKKVEQNTKPADRIGHVKLNGSHNTFQGKTQITPWVKIPDLYIGQIDYFINGERVQSQKNPPFGIELTADRVPERSSLQLVVYNRAGQQVSSKSYPLSAEVTVIIDDKLQKYEQPPVIREGSTLAPLRSIFEAMGATVSWDASTQTATGRKGETTISLRIGERKVIKNGQTVELEVPAQLINGHTMAPARFIGEAFGGVLEWDSQTRKVQIKTAAKTSVSSDAHSESAVSPADIQQAEHRPNSVPSSLADKLLAALQLTWKKVMTSFS